MDSDQAKAQKIGKICLLSFIGAILLFSPVIFIGLVLMSGSREIIIEWSIPCLSPLVMSVQVWSKKSRWFRMKYFLCPLLLSAGLWLLGYVSWGSILDCAIVWQESLLGLIVLTPIMFLASELWIGIASWWTRKRTVITEGN